MSVNSFILDIEKKKKVITLLFGKEFSSTSSFRFFYVSDLQYCTYLQILAV